MVAASSDKAAMMAALPVKPGEDPFVVATGGFYRRWFNLVDDIRPMLDTVATLKSTEDEDWFPPGARSLNAIAAMPKRRSRAQTALPRATRSCTPKPTIRSRASRRRITRARRSARRRWAR